LAGASKVQAPRFLLADSSRTILPHRTAIMTRLPGERLTLCEIRMSEAERMDTGFRIRSRSKQKLRARFRFNRNR
jgi:hypothetical protein